MKRKDNKTAIDWKQILYPAHDWRPIKEGMPPKGTVILLYDSNNNTLAGVAISIGKTKDPAQVTDNFCGHNKEQNITHWATY